MTVELPTGLLKSNSKGKKMKIPKCAWQIRVRDENPDPDNPNPYHWETLTTDDVFKDRSVIVFSLPGAFTPTCSTYQLPGFELLAPNFYGKDIDDIYVISVNDSFVMNAWAKQQKLEYVKTIPDGSGTFTRAMNMLVSKDNLSFGDRSWRYAMLVVDEEIVKMWVEPGKCDDAEDDPYGETAPEKIIREI